jgi:hypothetical protein
MSAAHTHAHQRMLADTQAKVGHGIAQHGVPQLGFVTKRPPVQTRATQPRSQIKAPGRGGQEGARCASCPGAPDSLFKLTLDARSNDVTHSRLRGVAPGCSPPREQPPSDRRDPCLRLERHKRSGLAPDPAGIWVASRSLSLGASSPQSKASCSTSRPVRHGQDAVSRCGSFQPGRGKWHVWSSGCFCR